MLLIYVINHLKHSIVFSARFCVLQHIEIRIWNIINLRKIDVYKNRSLFFILAFKYVYRFRDTKITTQQHRYASKPQNDADNHYDARFVIPQFGIWFARFSSTVYTNQFIAWYNFGILPYVVWLKATRSICAFSGLYIDSLYRGIHGPLARYVKLQIAHAPEMPGTFSKPLRVSDPDPHHDMCVTHVQWCMPGSLTSGFLWSWLRGKCPRHSWCMRNPPFYVSGKRPIQHFSEYLCIQRSVYWLALLWHPWQALGRMATAIYPFDRKGIYWSIPFGTLCFSVKNICSIN